MGRNILFITTDQQRFDALGCNGGRIARTPVIDGLAAAGVNYRRAYNQNTVCMPARATMITGKYVRSHGVIMNGIPLPLDTPDVVSYLRDVGGYRTALIGKAHFEPSSAPDKSYFENWAASRGSTGPHRGFERMELAGHTGRKGRSLFHYPKWLMETYPDEIEGFCEYVDKDNRASGRGGGETGAPRVGINPIPREHYHTDWVAERAINWLRSLDPKDNWFLWVSFPDPHPPWDPPQSELSRVSWRDLDLPDGHPGTREKIIKILGAKPRHWLEWYEGRRQFAFEAPPTFRPCDLTDDHIREVNAMVHISNELIDEACGRLLAAVTSLGWESLTDVIYTSDHGELQGDFGMLFKGPYHVDALMRVPLVWRPARTAAIAPAVIDDAVGHVDLAPTFCAIAGLPTGEWMQGQALPQVAGGGHERMITEWDSDFGGATLRLRSIYRDGYVCTVYEKTDYYDGTEGELYDLSKDPAQWRNLWSDSAYRARRGDLIADLLDNLPPTRESPLVQIAPV